MFDPSVALEVSRLQKAGIPYCAATIVDARGSIPQEVGAKAIFGSDGLLAGTIGGGRVEAHCAEQAAAMIANGERTRFMRINLNRDLGMTCAGELSLYFEVDRPELNWSVVVFGAGHVAQKLCRILIELDCRVVCIDPRKDWIARLPDSPKLEARLVAEFKDGVDAIRPGAMVVVVTMGHATDIPVLHAINSQGINPSYLGVIGSESKARTLRQQLAQDGIPSDFIDGITCPIGEKLGNNTPAEIAISVIVQLIKRRDDAKAASVATRA